MTFIPDLIRQRLVDLATNRLENHPAILSRLKIELESNSRSTSRMTSAVSNMEFAAASAMGQMHDIDERFLNSIDFWVRGQPEFLRVRAPIAPAQTAPVVPDQTVTTASDASAKRKRKPSWSVVAMPYMQKLYQTKKYRSTAVFHKALLAQAGTPDSPFIIVDGMLFCPKAGTTVEESSLGNFMKDVRPE